VAAVLLGSTAARCRHLATASSVWRGDVLYTLVAVTLGWA